MRSPVPSPFRLETLTGVRFGSGSTIPDGSYFILVNTTRLQIPEDFVVPDMIVNRARDCSSLLYVFPASSPLRPRHSSISNSSLS